MKNKLLVSIILAVVVLSGYYFLKKNLAYPSLQNGQMVTQPKLTPTPTPIQFHFDKTTNLKAELKSVNPQVQDSDFSELKNLISSLR